MAKKPKTAFKSIKIKETTYNKIKAQNDEDNTKTENFVPLHRTLDKMIA